MNEKIIEKRLLAMQRAVLHQLPDADNAHHQENSRQTDKPSEQNIDIDDLSVLFSLDPDSRRQLNLINHALNRLHRKEYHRCTQCGSHLPDLRLEQQPLTDLCESCDSKLDHNLH
jgi:RNA polymerase-binding transcription factor DksA